MCCWHATLYAARGEGPGTGARHWGQLLPVGKVCLPAAMLCHELVHSKAVEASTAPHWEMLRVRNAVQAPDHAA